MTETHILFLLGEWWESNDGTWGGYGGDSSAGSFYGAGGGGYGSNGQPGYIVIYY